MRGPSTHPRGGVPKFGSPGGFTVSASQRVATEEGFDARIRGRAPISQASRSAASARNRRVRASRAFSGSLDLHNRGAPAQGCPATSLTACGSGVCVSRTPRPRFGAASRWFTLASRSWRSPSWPARGAARLRGHLRRPRLRWSYGQSVGELPGLVHKLSRLKDIAPRLG